MKKAFLIVAMAFISLMAAAQDLNSVYYEHDTITMQEMMIEMANLNNQVRSFHNLELGGIAISTVGIGVSAYSAARLANLSGQVALNTYDRMELEKQTKNAKIGAWVGGSITVIGGILQLCGICKLKRDRMEITPNGVIIKLTPEKWN